MAIVEWMENEKHGMIEVPENTLLMDALREADASFRFPCGGKHSCGKCRVIAEGSLSAPEQEELELLGDAAPGIRLACFARVQGDISVRADHADHHSIAMDYSEGSAPLAPIYEGEYGAAVDIGTTTIAAYLFQKDRRKPLCVCGEMNDQGSYGADVLTRIDYTTTHGVEPLRDCIRAQLSRLLLRLCDTAGIEPSALGGACVTGNTTMLHLAAGLDPYPLSQAPFRPVSLFGGQMNLDLPGFPLLSVYLPRCISAYVGADITCSILASGITQSEENVLLVDIGTNGEMVLKTKEGLRCCATAAGPAFEGAGISCGSGAVDGAISEVRLEDGAFVCQTIGGRRARSICGSGLIDAIACMLEAGVIEYRGRFRKGQEPLAVISGDVSVSLRDVRQLQLAKGAIRGGMDTLLHAAGLQYEELSHIILCGGFGSYLNPVSAERIGLIPPGMAERTSAIGNAAGTGAGWILQSRSLIGETLSFTGEAQIVELSSSEVFKSLYIKEMNFPRPMSQTDAPR